LASILTFLIRIKDVPRNAAQAKGAIIFSAIRIDGSIFDAEQIIEDAPFKTGVT
jgi:hypothetical protein